MNRTRKKPLIKFLRTRLLLDDALSIFRGWYFNMSSRKAAPSEEMSDGFVLSKASLKINWREELKEINYSRIHNMELGCELVNHVKLKPGEVFSLRRFFGEMTEEQGFQKGPMFVRGRLEYVAGGGACLISTLLFNAALKANLCILEKHNHSTDFWGEDRFIGLGLDATYLFGRKDLKFKNTHTADIYIITELSMDDLMLHCRLISDKPLSCQVSILTEVLEELRLPENPSNDAGAKDRPYRKGWIVMTKRNVVEENASGREVCTYWKEETNKPYMLVSPNL